jgi:hypothetical protein
MQAIKNFFLKKEAKTLANLACASGQTRIWICKSFLVLFVKKNFLYQPPWRLTYRKQGKAFFFEKKKQKAFVCAVADLAGKVRVSTNKSFLIASVNVV